MKTIQLNQANAELSALIDAAANGEPTTINRDGKSAAVLVSVEDARRLYPVKPGDFVDYLRTFPGKLKIERDRRPVNDIDL